MSGLKTDKTTTQAEPVLAKPSKPAPAAAAKPVTKPVQFKPQAAEALAGDYDMARFARKAGEADPPVVQGKDLSGVPKIIVAAGRGKTGKTTFLRWMTERALTAGSSVMLADIDPTNASFSTYFENVARPDTDTPSGVLRWLQMFLDHCIASRQSAIIDVGGGDTTLREIASEMPGFASHLESEGMALVPFYLVGTQPDDLIPLATLTGRGLNPQAQALVLNEYSADAGLSRETAFARVVSSPIFKAHIADMVPAFMPRLHAADAVEARRSSFGEAADGHTTPPLGFFDRSRVQAWLDAMDRRFAGVKTWMP